MWKVLESSLGWWSETRRRGLLTLTWRRIRPSRRPGASARPTALRMRNTGLMMVGALRKRFL